MKKFLLKEEVIVSILNYLSGQPYRAVAQLIQALSQLEEAKLMSDQELDEKKDGD